MAEYNTNALKVFAQSTRAKLISLVETKIRYLLNTDDIVSRTYKSQIDGLRKAINQKTEKIVVEEVAYTWFNRVMALRFMDANGYNSPKVVSYADGQTRPEILQEALAGNVDSDLRISNEDLLLDEKNLYRRLLVAYCNHLSGSMPFLFERITDYTELLLPDDLLSTHSFISDIRNGMVEQDCKNVELMGWLYQFYIIDRKNDAENNKKRSGGLKSDEQAAATQLFTPHWVVRYMVENSLGRIWMTLHPDSNLINEMPYYIKPSDGDIDNIPEGIQSASDIRFLDPCMGSGHILVYAFDLFVKMYEEEGKLAKDIPALIIKNNLFGIDIDSRCYQLTCFAITMKARAYYSRYLRFAVQPNMIALQTIDQEIIRSTGDWSSKALIWLFSDIDTIGSLLKINKNEYDQIHVGEGLFAEHQLLLKKQAEFLSNEYHCVVTNPPYLGKGMGQILAKYMLSCYPNSRYDTMAAFMERCLDFCVPNGKVSMINMHSWMFRTSYESLRIYLLASYSIDSLLHLGPHAFDEIGGEIVQCAAFTIAKHLPKTGDYYRLVDEENTAAKEKAFLKGENKFVCKNQLEYKAFPGCPIGYWASPSLISAFSEGNYIGNHAEPRVGMATADNNRFVRFWYEVSLSNSNYGASNRTEAKKSGRKWFPFAKGGPRRFWYGNHYSVVNWLNDGFEIQNFKDKKTGRIRSHNYNLDYIFQSALTWGTISSGSPSFRLCPTGFLYSNSGYGMFFDDKEWLNFIFALLNTKVAISIVDVLSPGIGLESGYLRKIPIKSVLQDDVSNIVTENVQISKQDWDSHEISWDFKQNELLRISDSLYGVCKCKEVVVSKLVDVFKQEWSKKFNKLHENEEFLNSFFIDLYGLQSELSSDVLLTDVTILQNGEISIENNQVVWHDDVIIKQFLSYIVGCYMGRYSLNKEGLVIASQNQKIEESDLTEQTLMIDDDGIIPIILEEGVFADDMASRVENAIKIIFGSEHFYENLEYIKKVLKTDLRSYFYKDFYKDHLQLYSVKGVKRPIYWMFNSSMGDKNCKGYFKALVYMHRIDGDTLSRIHADYVRPYLNRLELQFKELQEQSLRDDLSSKQKNLLVNRIGDMQSMIHEIRNYEKSLIEMASARITIDLDDGVKVNYPKFYPLVEFIKGLDDEDDD